MNDDLWKTFRARPSDETFAPLYEATKALVYTLCRRILRHEDDAEDAFQAVYARLVAVARGVPRDHRDAPVENVVYRLAVREADNLRKRRRRRIQREVDMDPARVSAAQPSPEQLAADRQLRERVEGLLGELPERYRLPLVLHYFHGQSYADIARILDRPTGTVSVHISRALRKLDPLLRRAGLERAVTVFGAFLAGGELFGPPRAFSASWVFENATAAAAAAGSTTATATVASLAGKVTAGVLIMKTKAGVISLVLVLGAIGWIGFAPTFREPPDPERAPLATPVPVGSRAPATAGRVGEVAAPGANTTGADGTAARRPTLLRGEVLDAWSGEPVPGARVRVKSRGGAETEADADGRFEIAGLEPTRHEIQALSARHVALVRHVTVSAGGDDVCRFELEPGFEVDVLVVDHDGRPIEGARVYGAPDIIRQTTDPRGRARVGGVRRDDHDLYAARDGYGFSGAWRARFEDDARLGRVTIVLESRDLIHAVFEGRVTDADGKPVAGAEVAWGLPYNLPGLSDTTKTDEQGFYRLEAHEKEGEQLTVLAVGFALAWKEGLPPGSLDEPTVADFTLDEGHWLEGVVVDAEDRPLAGAEVTVYAQNEAGRRFELPRAGRPKTDGAGAFRLERLPGPRVRLEVRGPGATWDDHNGWSLFEEWFDVDRAVRCVLRPEGVIPLRVVRLVSGEPLTSFLVRHNGQWGDDWTVGDAVESDEGRFVLANLILGKEYDVKVEADGYFAKRRAGLRAATREDAGEVVFELSAGRELRGAIVDAETNAPVAGATVTHAMQSGDGGRIGWGQLSAEGSRLDSIQQVTSGADGSFTVLDGDEPGTLFIEAAGYERRMVRPAKRPEFLDAGRLRIPLSRGGRVVGRYLVRGEPQPAVKVSLRRRDGDLQSLGAVVTDEGGRYRWDGLAPGAYELSTLLDRGGTQHQSAWMRRQFDLARGEKKTVDLGGDMGPWSLTGRVLEGEDSLYDLRLRLDARFPWAYRRLEGFTDADGRYRFDGLEAGEYDISVVRRDPTFRIVNRRVTIAGDTELDLEFAKLHRVTGLLRPAAPSLDPGRIDDVTLLTTGDLSAPEENPEQINQSASGRLEDGVFEISGRFRGEYRLELSYRSGDDLVRIGVPRVFQLDNLDGDVDVGEVAAPALGALRVALRFEPDGIPPPRATWLSFHEPGAANRLSSVVLHGKSGEARIERINAGRFELRPWAPAFLAEPARIELTVAPGEETTVEVTLRATGELRGSVTDASTPGRKVAVRRVTLAGGGERRVLDAVGAAGTVAAGSDRLTGNSFRFTGLDAGTYRVRVEADGFRAHEYEVDIEPGRSEPSRGIDLEPEKSR